LHHGLTVVSRDTSDFNKAHVSVLNPWHESTYGKFPIPVKDIDQMAARVRAQATIYRE
jgi:hypothetical protein